MKKLYIANIVVFVLLISVFFFGFLNVDRGMSKEDTQRAKDAIQKAARECYSIEGAYPKDIEYLKENYGLFIQEEKYMIRYHYIGANIMPDTDVFRKGE